MTRTLILTHDEFLISPYMWKEGNSINSTNAIILCKNGEEVVGDLHHIQPSFGVRFPVSVPPARVILLMTSPSSRWTVIGLSPWLYCHTSQKLRLRPQFLQHFAIDQLYGTMGPTMSLVSSLCVFSTKSRPLQSWSKGSCTHSDEEANQIYSALVNRWFSPCRVGVIYFLFHSKSFPLWAAFVT